MNHSKHFLSGLAVSAVLAAFFAFQQARAAASDEEIANGLDPITLGQALGNYQGGRLIAGEFFPGGSSSVARATDEEIANGLDPITLGQALGNYPGGARLAGEYVPYDDSVQTAQRR